jgi:hypothetical protein
MQVSFAPNRLHKALPRPGDNHVARPLLCKRGARVVLGGEALANGLARSIVPSPNTLFGPRGACLASEHGRLFVCDTGHHRLMVWRQAPSADQADADIVIGQPDFSGEGRNARGEIGAATLNMPTGVAACDGVLAVADAWNHRVLIWQPCDFVLGQTDFMGLDHNRASYYPTSSAMNMPYGLTVQGGMLVVTDTANSRLVGFELDGLSMDAPAIALAGQPKFSDKGDNRWRCAARDSVCWPYQAAACGDLLVIADAGNNRVLLWEAVP